MARGLAIPVGANSGGGIKTVDGDVNNNKIIKLSLGSDDSENAFQLDIGLGQAMVFDLSDRTLQAKIRRKLVSIFRDFEIQKRFKLKTDTVKFNENEADQELELEFKYIDLESDDVRTVNHSFVGI